jgi:hypothetical protein
MDVTFVSPINLRLAIPAMGLALCLFWLAVALATLHLL